jgi:hypothetical protein
LCHAWKDVEKESEREKNTDFNYPRVRRWLSLSLVVVKVILLCAFRKIGNNISGKTKYQSILNRRHTTKKYFYFISFMNMHLNKVLFIENR